MGDAMVWYFYTSRCCTAALYPYAVQHTLCFAVGFYLFFCINDSLFKTEHATECIRASSSVHAPPSVALTGNISGGAGIGLRPTLESISRSHGGFLQGEGRMCASYCTSRCVGICCRFIMHEVFSQFFFVCRLSTTLFGCLVLSHEVPDGDDQHSAASNIGVTRSFYLQHCTCS